MEQVAALNLEVAHSRAEEQDVIVARGGAELVLVGEIFENR